MKLFILFQTDIWKNKSSRVCCGVFDSRTKAIDHAKYYGLYTDKSKVVIVEVILNQFEES